MQVFLPYNNMLEVATCLIKDKRRYHKQIIECGQIIKAIKGETRSWSNHPIVWQYRDYLDFLIYYKLHLEHYRDFGIDFIFPKTIIYPPFLENQGYLDSHKRRLYQKNSKAFSEFAEFDDGYTFNLYCVPLDFVLPKRKEVFEFATYNSYKIVRYDF